MKKLSTLKIGKAKRVKRTRTQVQYEYVVIQVFRKREIVSGMTEGDQPQTKETLTEKYTVFPDKKNAEMFFKPEMTPQEGNAENGEIRRLLCRVEKKLP